MNNDKEEFNNTSQSTEFGWSLIEGTTWKFICLGFMIFLNLILGVGALLSFSPSFYYHSAYNNTRRPLNNNNGLLKSAFVSFAKDTRHPLESKNI